MHERNIEELKQALLEERRSAYLRLSGGFPIPLAGAVYWFALAIAGYQFDLRSWVMIAVWGTGGIFPLALLFAKLFKNPFMKDESPVNSVLVPTFIGMLLFWAIMVAALQTAPEMAPLVLAIGLSMHWPVIGWTYGRSVLFSGHAIIRAVIVVYLWLQFPEHRLTWLPLSVAVVYVVTVLAIWVDIGILKRARK